MVGVFGWVLQYLVHRVPDSELALLPVVLSLTLLMPVVQSVLTSGMGRFLTEAYARGDTERIGRIMSSLVPWQAGGALVIFLGGMLVAWKINAIRDEEPLNVSIEDLDQLAWRRRSVRWYQDKPVPREVIDRAIEVAKLSPSACNRQPFEFRVFDDPKLAKEVVLSPAGPADSPTTFPA